MKINKELQDIINSSKIIVHPGEWFYAEVDETNIPDIKDCFMISKDADEITVIYEKSMEHKIKTKSKNKDLRKLIEIKVTKPFYAVGFLASVTDAISSQGCNNLIISTYSKDYVMVTLEHFETAMKALNQIGFKES